MLKFDYELVNGFTIEAVSGKGRREYSDGSLQYDEILIEVDSGYVHVMPDENTDELNIFLREKNDPLVEANFLKIPELSECVGRRLGWCWECRNYLGYGDMFLISVSGLEPDYGFVGLGSQVQLNRLSRVFVRSSASMPEA